MSAKDDDEGKRTLKLDDLTKGLIDADDVKTRVAKMEERIRKLEIRAELFAGRQAQLLTMIDSTKRLVHELWEWMTNLSSLLARALESRPRGRGKNNVLEDQGPSTALFRKQHQEILRVAGELTPLLDAMELAKDAEPARQLLTLVAVKLDAHLDIEDQVLQSLMREHDDDEVRRLLRIHFGETGGLRQQFFDFNTKWQSLESIQGAADAFVHDTLNIFDMMFHRIEREDRELYPLLDRTS